MRLVVGSSLESWMVDDSKGENLVNSSGLRVRICEDLSRVLRNNSPDEDGGIDCRLSYFCRYSWSKVLYAFRIEFSRVWYSSGVMLCVRL
jgi:hypothetical protein